MSARSLLDQARGRECQIRSPVCNFDTATTVACHIRMIGISGMGYKAPPILCAWGCSSCHQLADSGQFQGVSMTNDERDLLLLRGMARTQAILWQEGRIRA